MKISIITATYNSSKHIKNCVTSVLNQDYDNIEYIIIDGLSKDDTPKIIETFKPNDKINFFSEKDSGIYDALNKGVAKATGDVIGFLHSDDLLASTSIITDIVNVFKSKSCDGVYGDLVYTAENNIDSVLRYWKSKPFKKELLRQGWMPAHPTLFLKKEVYTKVGNFNLSYKIAADYDFMVRVLKQDLFSIAYLPKIITRMRAGGASNKSLANIILKSKEDLKVMQTNNIGGVLTLFKKNFSKIIQFVKK